MFVGSVVQISWYLWETHVDCIQATKKGVLKYVHKPEQRNITDFRIPDRPFTLNEA